MSTIINMGTAVAAGSSKSGQEFASGTLSPTSKSVEDDMMYGVNVAACSMKVRMGFVRKVYAIVATQLLVTVIIGATFMNNAGIKAFVQSSPQMMQLSFFVAMGSLMALFVKRHQSPANMILLAVFTLAESYSVGTIITFYDSTVVLQAAIICAAITVGLTVFTFQTKYDFTPLNGMLISCLWIMIAISFLQHFMPFEVQDNLMYSVCGAVLFSLFIVVDTQRILKKVSTDEYILCAIDLYLDIINLFLEILRILNKNN